MKGHTQSDQRGIVPQTVQIPSHSTVPQIVQFAPDNKSLPKRCRYPHPQQDRFKECRFPFWKTLKHRAALRVKQIHQQCQVSSLSGNPARLIRFLISLCS